MGSWTVLFIEETLVSGRYEDELFIVDFPLENGVLADLVKCRRTVLNYRKSYPQDFDCLDVPRAYVDV
jgi:hypothetical protein